jgi:hypothetical protein
LFERLTGKVTGKQTQKHPPIHPKNQAHRVGDTTCAKTKAVSQRTGTTLSAIAIAEITAIRMARRVFLRSTLSFPRPTIALRDAPFRQAPTTQATQAP